MNGSFEFNNVAINLALFKQIRFYHLLDQSSKRILNVNVYQLILVFITVISECFLIYGHLGYFIEMEDTTDNIAALLLIFVNIINFLSLIKAITFVYKANDIWYLLNVTRVDFLSSVRCRKHYNVHQKYRDISIKITYFLFVMALLGNVVWGFYPLVLYATSYEDKHEILHADGTMNRRIENIINYRFPVTVFTFNNYFILFYVMELVVLTFNLFLYAVFDIFIVSFSFAIIAQYETIDRAFKNIGYNKQMHKNDNGNSSVNNFCDDYKSILIDQRQLYLMLKLFYSTVWYIILLSVAFLSGAIIILSYSFVVIYLSAESLPMLSIFKISVPFFTVIIELFVFCYLMETINIKKESVNFGMYSSNWTAMDLKTIKLLLLALRVNKSNKLMIKTTPNKIVNLQLFANVMKTSFNVVSVLLKSRST